MILAFELSKTKQLDFNSGHSAPLSKRVCFRQTAVILSGLRVFGYGINNRVYLDGVQFDAGAACFEIQYPVAMY